MRSVEANISRTMRAYFSNAADRDPMFSSIADSGVKAELCIPVIAAEAVIGAISLQNNDDKQFSKIEIEQINSLLAELATPLENL